MYLRVIRKELVQNIFPELHLLTCQHTDKCFFYMFLQGIYLRKTCLYLPQIKMGGNILFFETYYRSTIKSINFNAVQQKHLGNTCQVCTLQWQKLYLLQLQIFPIFSQCQGYYKYSVNCWKNICIYCKTDYVINRKENNS